MPDTKPLGPIAPVITDARARALLDEDLGHLSSGAARPLHALLRTTELLGGIPIAQLRRCDAEGRDGTRLPNCLKTYVPPPVGTWGLVLAVVEHPVRAWALRPLAYGRRHPEGRGASVYQVAHRRLHG